MKEQIVIS